MHASRPLHAPVLLSMLPLLIALLCVPPVPCPTQEVFDFPTLRAFMSRADFTFVFDALHAVTGAYAGPLFVDELGGKPVRGPAAGGADVGGRAPEKSRRKCQLAPLMAAGWPCAAQPCMYAPAEHRAPRLAPLPGRRASATACRWRTLAAATPTPTSPTLTTWWRSCGATPRRCWEQPRVRAGGGLGGFAGGGLRVDVDVRAAAATAEPGVVHLPMPASVSTSSAQPGCCCCSS